MFSQTAEYGLRVVVYLASLDGEPATIKQIAARTMIPQGYLAKVLQGLSRGGLIWSQRGLHGGSVLTRSPDDISVYDVIEAVEPFPRIKTCPLGLKSHGARLCPLHKRLDSAMASVEKTFRDSSIADLLREPNPSKPLCDIPPDGKPSGFPRGKAAFVQPRVLRKRR